MPSFSEIVMKPLGTVYLVYLEVISVENSMTL